jgi:serine protease Do
MNVVIAELPSNLLKTAKEFDNLLKGVQVQEITPEIKKRLNIPKHATGVMVSGIEEGSAAGGILAQGDILIEINKKKIASLKDYEAAASKIKSGEDILLLIFRNGSTIYVTLSAR